MSCFHPILLYRDKPEQRLVPCGRCDACLLSRSRQWSLRVMHELRYHETAMFLTLTYRDEELVYGGNFRATLVKSHLQNFWKRYRKYLNAQPGQPRIRYFACGEYGSLRYRPHYHAIIFGHDFEDKKAESVKMDNVYYSSDKLDSLWGHGHCIIGAVTAQSAAYVARYTLKKAFGSDAKKWRKENMIEPEFLCMSLKSLEKPIPGEPSKPGGIGAKFYEEFNSDMFPTDIMVLDNGSVTKPPRYYLKLYKRYNPQSYESIMLLRKQFQAINARDNLMTRRKAKELVQRAKLRLLNRPLED